MRRCFGRSSELVGSCWLVVLSFLKDPRRTGWLRGSVKLGALRCFLRLIVRSSGHGFGFVQKNHHPKSRPALPTPCLRFTLVCCASERLASKHRRQTLIISKVSISDAANFRDRQTGCASRGARHWVILFQVLRE